jgi:adenylylsulfate kinase
MKILICGLPGSGKTWLAKRLADSIENCAWYNADIIRTASNDWDFTLEGRMRQASRMKTFADFEASNGRSVICDFVAPTEKSRLSFNPEYLIWLDTIKEGRVVANKKEELETAKDLPFEIESLEKSDAFKDTTRMFESPSNADKIIKTFLSDEEINNLAIEIQNV